MVNEQPQVIWFNPPKLTVQQINSQFSLPIIGDISSILSSVIMIMVLAIMVPMMTSMSQGFNFGGSED
jgi:hypothetical protein